MVRRAAAAVLALVPASPALAQAWQCHAPATVEVPPLPTPDGPRRVLPITGYTLALTWSPEFCRAHGGENDHALQCDGKLGRFGFVLHGLWPESTPGTWPQWCAAAPVPQRTVRGALCLTPSPRLIVHEWAKHGSCMARGPTGYFHAAAALFASLSFPDLAMLSRKDGLVAGDLRRAIVEATPALRPEAIRIKANPPGWLEEMHVCYSKDFLPAPCADRGVADDAPLKIWRSFRTRR